MKVAFNTNSITNVNTTKSIKYNRYLCLKRKQELTESEIIEFNKLKDYLKSLQNNYYKLD
jgi:hypothetical protein